MNRFADKTIHKKLLLGGTMPRIVSSIKTLFVRKGRSARTIKSGAFRGLRMDLNLSCQSQIYLGLFERELYNWIEKLSRDTKTVIDIGACEGEYTLYFLKKTSAVKVITFEPLEYNQLFIRKNLELNDITLDSRLEIYTGYVGCNDKSEYILDSFLPAISPPCLIKIDVDGGEVNILQGAAKLLALPQVCWIIETHSQGLEEQCVQILRQSNYITTIVPNAWWRCFIPELRPSIHNRWLIAVRDMGM